MCKAPLRGGRVFALRFVTPSPCRPVAVRSPDGDPAFVIHMGTRCVCETSRKAHPRVLPLSSCVQKTPGGLTNESQVSFHGNRRISAMRGWWCWAQAPAVGPLKQTALCSSWKSAGCGGNHPPRQGDAYPQSSNGPDGCGWCLKADLSRAEPWADWIQTVRAPWEVELDLTSGAARQPASGIEVLLIVVLSKRASTPNGGCLDAAQISSARKDGRRRPSHNSAELDGPTVARVSGRVRTAS